MKNLLKGEDIGIFLLSILFFSLTSFPWWYFPVLILLPDISMIGYIKNPKTGALIYNIFHHQGVAALVIAVGWISDSPVTLLIGSILLGHSALDRIAGYGLKYQNSFHHTHLGKIGPAKHQPSEKSSKTRS